MNRDTVLVNPSNVTTLEPNTTTTTTYPAQPATFDSNGPEFPSTHLCQFDSFAHGPHEARPGPSPTKRARKLERERGEREDAAMPKTRTLNPLCGLVHLPCHDGVSQAPSPS